MTPMRKCLFILLALALWACSKPASDPSVKVLEEKTFSEEAATFMVLVSGNGVWSVSASDAWLHVEERFYKDEAAFEVGCDSNESSIGDHRFCRTGKIFITAWDGSSRDEVIVRQEGLVPEIELKPIIILSSEGSYSMPMESNLSDRERSGLSFSCDAPWITDIRFGRDGESVVFHAAAGSGRSADITVTFTDVWGRKFTSTAKVTQ